MQTNKSKNQNQQIPSEQGRAVQANALISKPIPFHEKQSPKCLVANHQGSCGHPNCLKANNKPKYYGISIAEFYNGHEFTEFDVMSKYGNPNIIPHNPNPGSDNEFELFRQSLNAVIHLAGKWPINVTLVSREHVIFKWTEFIDTIPSFNFETLQNEWKKVCDVKQFAFYAAPVDNVEFQDIDINSNADDSQTFKFEKGGSNE
jgi:hypothetical protein